MHRIYNLILQFIFISVCFCEITDDKEKYISAFVNHLNGLPNQNLFYEDWESIKLEEVSDNELYTEIKIKASDQNVYSKYQNCTGYITIEENGKLRVHGAQCSDIVESWTENMEELVTDVTTNDGPIQLENEVQTENMSTSGERFIAVPRERPAPCIGCASYVDPNAVGVKDLADLGIKQLNRHEPNVHHSLNTVLVVERQVQAIGGVRYIITLTVDSNNCTLNETEDCNFQKTCKIAVLEKPWQRLADGSKFRAILSNNCTEEWLFDENGLTTPSDSNFNNQSNDIGTSTSDNYDNTENEDNVKAIHNIEVQAQPNAEKTLTEEQMRELEDQIIPLNKFNQPTDNSYFAVSDATQTHVAEEKVNNLEAVKSKSNDFMATQEPERRRDDESLSDDKKKAIDDLLNFFDFSGIKSTADNDDLSRIKRDYGSDLQMFKLADKYKTMKTKMKNAQFIQKLAQSLVDYLNEMDIEVKTRMLKEVISAEEEFEKDQRYFYVQARVAIPCDNDKCKDKEVKMCNGIIDATGNQPSVLYTVCSNEPTKGLGKLKDIRHDDPILLKFLNHAMKKLDMESKLPYALRIRKILSASTQRVSGTLTKISVEIEYTECFKTVPLFRRRNCTVLENLGFKLCDIEVFERHWLRETKITYVCTERPVDEIFVNDPKNNTKEASTRLNIDDPQVLDIVQEALQYLEEKSNRNNKQKLVEVKSISTQQLAGLLIDVDFTVGYTACTSQFKDDINTCKLLENEPLRNCSVEVWERPWLDEERLVNVTCDKLSSKSDVIKRYKRNTHVGSQVEKNVENPKYKNLAEESLQKYLQSGVSQHHQLIDIEKVTVQVVSGTKTRIDFQISPTNCQIDSNGLPTSANCVVQNSNDIITCHSEIWERQWLNSTDIDVTCDSKSKQSRKRRSILLNGNEVEEQPNKYKELADDCITNFLVTYGYTQHYKVLKVNRVTKLNVNGELIKLDFVAASTNCKVKNGYPISSPCEIIDNRKILFCHADVWNKSMMNGRIMNVNCEPEEEKFRKKRDTARVGSFQTKDKSDPRYKELAAKSLSKYILKKHKSQYHEVVSIEQVTSQVVSGINTKIDFKASPTNCEVDRHGKPTSSLCEIENPDIILLCSSQIWEQPWLGKEEITVNCHPDKSRVKRWLSEVPDYTKYKLVGGPMEQNANDPKYMQLAEDSLAKYMSTNGFTQKHTIIRVEKVTTQVVSGSKTKIDFKVQSPTNVLDCHSEIWDRPWLKVKEINIQCLPTTSRKKRHLPGGLKDRDNNDPKYMQMAEESLAKYVSTNGFTQKHTIIRVERVTTQVVSGSLSKIDFKVQSPTNVLNCHSEIWEQSWLNKKEINVTCSPSKSRKRREVQLFNAVKNVNRFQSIDMSRRSGGHQEQDPTKPEYSQLAEEALQKYQQRKSSEFLHKVTKVNRVVKQVVSGTKYQIDFTAAPTTCSSKVSKFFLCDPLNSTVLYCHTDIWDRPWLKRKDINVFCNLSGGDSDQENGSNNQDDRKKRSIAVLREPETEEYKLDNLTSPLDNKIEAPEDRSNDMDSPIVVSKHMENSDYLKQLKFYNNRYLHVAEESLRKYEIVSESEVFYKVIQIHYVNEEEDFGLRLRLDFTAAPSNCSISKHNYSNHCQVIEPEMAISCHADVRYTLMLEANLVQDIEIHCKRKKTKNFNEKSMEKVRNKRYIPYDENVEDDLLYYYADVIVGKLNDEKHSDKQNLYKLITIHDARRTVHMKTPLVRMYLEVAKSYCLRDQSLEQLSACNEIENMPHLLCFARLWPSSYDDAVLEASEFSCEDNFMSFSDQTGLHSNQLLQLSLLILNRESPLVNIFRSLGDTRIVPTLDYKEPTKLSFYAFQTNCTKEYAAAAGFDSKLVGDTCFPTQFETARSCMSLIYMSPNSRDVRYVNVTCTSPIANRRQKRSLPIRSDNITREDVTIQRLLHESLEKLEMDSVHRYKQRVLVINRYSTKFGVRKETTIDFDVGYTNCLKYEWVDNITTCEFVEHLPRRHCVSVVFEKLWSDNYREIRVNCDDDETPLEANMELETAQSATILGNEALKRIEYKYPDPFKQIVVRLFSLEKHVVAGIHYRMKMEVGYTNCMALSVDNDCKLDPLRFERKFCRVSVWLRTWTNHPPSYQVSCDYQEGTTSELFHERQAGALFSHFLATYKPSYINNHFELQNRYKIFQENVKKIHELNVYEMGTARYAVTQFADLSTEEFRSKHLGLNPKLRDENQVPMVEAEIPPVNIPDTFDWREHDAVTEVKDQGSCGSCWAFSVTGNIEGQWKRHSGKLVSLSEQELVDCDKLDNGCNGGLPDNAYRAIEQLGGIETENDYPYEGEDDKCAYNASLSRVQISGAVNISSNETNMAKWLYKNGPISIGINANAMQFYVGGISHPWRVMCNPNNLDHGVLIVGYGTKDYPLFNKKLPYWIVKNSWGKSWGEQGYYRVYRGDGTCGVNQMASSSVI